MDNYRCVVISGLQTCNGPSMSCINQKLSI